MDFAAIPLARNGDVYISSACALSTELKLTQTFDKLNTKDEPK